jgi:hypothetical protein
VGSEMPKRLYSEESKLKSKIAACNHYNKPVDDTERFWSYVDVNGEDECWEWRAYKNKTGGYGMFTHNGITSFAHRFAYELTYGKLPDGFCALHKCDNRPCCNPKHLFKGTYRDNNADRQAKGRSVVLKGVQHPGATLSEFDVYCIRILYQSGIAVNIISNMYNKNYHTIWNVCKRRSWKHI